MSEGLRLKQTFKSRFVHALEVGVCSEGFYLRFMNADETYNNPPVVFDPDIAENLTDSELFCKALIRLRDDGKSFNLGITVSSKLHKIYGNVNLFGYPLGDDFELFLEVEKAENFSAFLTQEDIMHIVYAMEEFFLDRKF